MPTKKRKLVPIIFAVVLLASAVASASASASPQYFVGGSSFTGTETIAAKAEAPFVFGFTLMSAVKVECKKIKMTSASIFESRHGSASAIVFEECKVTSPAGCKLINSKGEEVTTLETGAVSIEATDVGTTEVHLTYQPSVGVLLFPLRLSGCSNEGLWNVKGSIQCNETAPATEAVLKKCEFTATSGSTLTVGVNSVSFVGTAGLSLAGTNLGKVWTTAF